MTSYKIIRCESTHAMAIDGTHITSATDGHTCHDHHYRRDSFDDRICDDLCEDLLSYLPIEDKIRMQCVSKRFRRLLHRRQYDLIVSRQTLGHRYRRVFDVKTFESLLKRFPLITFISVDLIGHQSGDQLIGLIIKYCKHLKAIHMNFFDKQHVDNRTEYRLLVKEETLKRFFERFSRQLRRIVVFENFVHILNVCHNLYELNLTNSYYSFVCLRSAFTEDTIDAMRCVRRLKFNYNSTTDYPLFALFVDNNRNSLVSIECNETIDSEDNTRLLCQISRLIYHSLRMIAKNCRHLSQLEISFYSSDRYLPFMVQNDVLNAIKHFRRLQKFAFHFIECCESDFLNVCLNKCGNVTDLSLYSINEINDKFFVDIDTHLPNLRHLKVINADISDAALNWLSKLSKLETISLFNLSDGSTISESSVWSIVDNCPKISSIKLFFSSLPVGPSNHQIDARIQSIKWKLMPSTCYTVYLCSQSTGALIHSSLTHISYALLITPTSTPFHQNYLRVSNKWKLRASGSH
ncbi:unnamed protein product [Oppiella nova]|uniref:F-box domain-containing protein n=1 Tax=Oppiella nova TaxID=334625 RepID=A0A7R9QCW9_9ACAR|nr:unnamed protein product [Oppiella nova]CAG2162761.1 unnamed protein product [Oppiella nova]